MSRLAVAGTVLAVAIGMDAAAARAETCPVPLTQAIATAERQLVTLYKVRGTRKEVETGMPVEDFHAALNDYLRHGQFAAQDDRSGLLFYIALENEVCLLYARQPAGGNDGPLAIDWLRLATAPADLHALVDDRMTRFMTSGAERVRAPEPISDFAHRQVRGATTLVERRPSGESHTQLLKSLDEALVPRAIASDVESLTGLAVVPILNLGRVPFAALDPDGDGTPLIDRTVVNVEPSMQGIFARMIYGWEPAPPETPVIVGDPDASNDPDWRLPRLPGAAREAAEIAAAWGVAPLASVDATPERVVDAMADADYIHIAAHGLSSTEEPMDNSFLALTGGRLTARRIQDLYLERMPIVVLSACQSALGGPLEAGIIGVARSFMIAGAINVVASLWNVEDEATSWIMTRFARLLASSPPGDALRRAQIEARERWPSPRVWAAFIAYGPRIVTLPADEPK